jgi:plasmid stability protein
MATIQIRDIPDEDYETLRMDARAEGKSLQAYMREAAIDRARRARKAAVIREMRRIAERNTGTGITLESILAARDEGRE